MQTTTPFALASTEGQGANPTHLCAAVGWLKGSQCRERGDGSKRPAIQQHCQGGSLSEPPWTQQGRVRSAGVTGAASEIARQRSFNWQRRLLCMGKTDSPWTLKTPEIFAACGVGLSGGLISWRPIQCSHLCARTEHASVGGDIVVHQPATRVCSERCRGGPVQECARRHRRHMRICANTLSNGPAS